MPDLGDQIIRNRPIFLEVAAQNKVKDQAAWNALVDPAAKLEALRELVLLMMESAERDGEKLGKLFRTFGTEDGGQTVLRRNLVVANGADIVIEK